MILLALLGLGSPAFALSPLPRPDRALVVDIETEAFAEVGRQPLDPVLRLALANLLAVERPEETLEILRGLLTDDTVGPKARAALTARLISAPAKRSWDSLYKLALTGGAPNDAVALRAQQAAAARLPKTPATQPKPASVKDLEAAWREAPTSPELSRLWGEARLTAGANEEALSPLGVVLDAWPADRAVLGLYTKAALGAGKGPLALDRLRAGIAAAQDGKSRDTLLGDLTRVAVVVAEAHKSAERPEAALQAYMLALAVRPRDTAVVLGAAGLEWQTQDLEAAWALYNWALTLEPGRVDALLGALTVGLSAGHGAEARLLLDAVRSKDPRVTALRASVARAERAKDALAAVRSGDAALAVTEFQALLAKGDQEPEFFHGLADALASLGRHEDAILAWREALRLDPLDAWAVVGEANALVTLGRPQDARSRLAEAFPKYPPPGAAEERRRVEARAYRMEGDAARAAGDLTLALQSYGYALGAFPDVWACVSIGGLYLADGQLALALAFYDEALRLAPGEDVAIAGRALTLEALGRPAEGLALLDAQIAAAPSDVNRAARADLAPRVAVALAMEAREAGDLHRARQIVNAALADGRPITGLYAALALVELDLGNAEAAVRASRAALIIDPSSAWARSVMVAAGRACGCTRTILGELAAAVAAHPSQAASQDEAEARLDAALQEAERRHREGRDQDAVDALERAEKLADRPDLLSRVAGGWLGLGRGREALALYERALVGAPDDIIAIIGRAGALEAVRRLAAAENALVREYERLGDPRLGIALADTQRRRGRYPSAVRVLAKVGTTVTIPTESASPTAPTLPTLPLPSGATPDLALGQNAKASVTLDVSVEKARVAAAVARQRAPRASASVAYLSRGLPGAVGLDALMVPIDTGPSPAGPVRIDIELVPIHLSDGTITDDGVAASVGLATPDARLFGFNARLGTSPIGFVGGVYPTWSARLAARLVPNLSLGFATGRAPRGDSRVSWAGDVFTSTGQLYGRVSEIWGQAWTSWTPPHADLGLSGRGGYVEGIGVAPNPFGEGVVWAGRTFPIQRVNLRAGVDGVALTYARREDEFIPGHGGYFSPPLFVLGLARIDVDYSAERLRICAGVGGGPRYQDGGDTAFAGSGVAGTGTAHIGLGARVASRWDLTLDSRGQISTDGWHQVGALARLTWGVPTALPGAPSLTTLAAPGLALPGDGQACTVAP